MRRIRIVKKITMILLFIVVAAIFLWKPIMGYLFFTPSGPGPAIVDVFSIEELESKLERGHVFPKYLPKYMNIRSEIGNKLILKPEILYSPDGKYFIGYDCEINKDEIEIVDVKNNIFPLNQVYLSSRMYGSTEEDSLVNDYSFNIPIKIQGKKAAFWLKEIKNTDEMYNGRNVYTVESWIIFRFKSDSMPNESLPEYTFGILYKTDNPDNKEAIQEIAKKELIKMAESIIVSDD